MGNIKMHPLVIGIRILNNSAVSANAQLEFTLFDANGKIVAKKSSAVVKGININGN